MPGIAFFTCQQRHAPELFWKPDYQRHPNGALRVVEIVMSAPLKTWFIPRSILRSCSPTPDEVLVNTTSASVPFPSGRAPGSPRASMERTGGENPYLLHQDLGQVMTKSATVVRVNSQLKDAFQKVSELAVRAQQCSLSDTGNWTNQNVVFTKALKDMFPLAKAIVLGALARDGLRYELLKMESHYQWYRQNSS